MLSNTILKNPRNGAKKLSSFRNCWNYLQFKNPYRLNHALPRSAWSSSIRKYCSWIGATCSTFSMVQALFWQLVDQCFTWKDTYEQGIATVDTGRSNRLYNCKLSDDKSMKKKGRGSTEIWVPSFYNVELWAVKWFDNRAVALLSTYESVEPTRNIEKFDKKASKYVNVSCPSIVTIYSQFMGGVDLLDGLLKPLPNPHKI